jgi:general secretion pathway protein L
MSRILGLDLGSYSLKGALLEQSLRGHQMRAYAEVPRTESAIAETLRALMGDLFAQYHFPPDQIIVALPGLSFASHFIQLPFVETKQIDAALPFEVESQLPFDLSEVVFGYHVVSQRDKKSDLLVGVVRKDELRPLLASLKEANIDPRIVTHPAIAYQGLLLAMPQAFNSGAEGSSFAMVDLGHMRTVAAVGSSSNGIEFARVFPGGGADLTRAIVSEFSISAAEAEQWKTTQGAIASAAKGPGAERAAGALARSLQTLVRELRATLKTFTARTRRTVTRVYLCGGTARLAGLDEYLSEQLGIPTQLLRLSSDLATIPEQFQASAPQAYALALRGQTPTGRGSLLNLRREEFAFKGDFDYLRTKIRLVGGYAALLLLLLIVSGIVRNSVLARREREVEAELCNITQRVLGKCEKNFERALNLLHGKESAATAIPKLSAVSLLAETSQRIPSDVTVTFDRLEIDLDRVMLQGDTDSTKQIDRISSGLKSFRCFHEIKQGKVEKSKDGRRINFRLDVQIECPEQGTNPQG